MLADARTRYVEVTATLAQADAERAAGILRSLADAGTWIDQPFTQPTLEDGATPVEGAPVRVHVYFRGDDAAANAALVPAALRAAGIAAECRQRDVSDEDWAESWKEHFHIERYGERIVVVPSWLAYDPRAGDVVIALDPGMAFGTGQHETTRMCLEALERSVSPGARVLDAGCGSGILSIAAAKLGATVVALDIDPDCVRITRENAERNGCADRIDAKQTALPDGIAGGAYDVIVANIIAGTIIESASAFASALAPGGLLICSGIIGERERAVTDALTAVELRIDAVHTLGEWRCIEARAVG
jgi:ribosomal protein L11 methyltransferase